MVYSLNTIHKIINKKIYKCIIVQFDKRVLNSIYEICPDLSVSISFINLSISMVILNSSFIIFINYYESISPCLSDLPPKDTKASTKNIEKNL